MSSATLAPHFATDWENDDFAPLDVKVVVAAHPLGKFMCDTSDGCGSTCANGASACDSYTGDAA